MGSILSQKEPSDEAGTIQYLTWQYLNGLPTPPTTGTNAATLQFVLPSEPGVYEFRLFVNDNVLTRSAEVSVAQSHSQIALNGASPNNGGLVVTAGAVVTASVTGAPGNATDWLGLYAAGAPDAAPIDFRYLNGTTAPPAVGSASGSATFVPPAIGTYEVRLFAQNTYERLATSETITVTPSEAGITVNGVSSPAMASVGAGATLGITVTNGPGNANDWITLAPPGASDTTYVQWQYLNGLLTPPSTGLTNATLHFIAPVAPGIYELRLFANNGYMRLATAAVNVNAPIARIAVGGILPPGNIDAPGGSVLSVAVSDSPGNQTDWLALAPSDAPNTTYVSWAYLNGTQSPPSAGMTNATVDLIAPTLEGTYEVRLFASNSFARLATSARITVAGSAQGAHIDRLLPPYGYTGQIVRIEGRGFGAAQGSGTVLFNGVSASVVAGSWSDGSISVKVPAAAASGPLTVFVGVQGSNAVDFEKRSFGNVPLAVAVTAPGPGMIFTPPTGAIIQAAVTPSDVEVARVDFFVNDALVGNAVELPYQIPWTPGVGAASLKAVVVDTFGGQTPSEVVPVVVQHTDGLQLMPMMVGLLVGETRRFQARDLATGTVANGMAVTVLDETIAIRDPNDPSGIVAIAPGETIVQVGDATATVTVYPGSQLPPGVVRWSAEPFSNFVEAIPTNDSVADLFGTDGAGTIAALTTDGAILWTAPIDQDAYYVLAEPNGGAVAVGSSLVRYNPNDGAESWRVANPVGGDVRLNAAGMLVGLQSGFRVVAIDPADGNTRYQSGTIEAVNHSVRTNDCDAGPGVWSTDSPGQVFGPVFAADGSTYFGALTRTYENFSNINSPFCDQSSTTELTLKTYRVDNGGGVSAALVRSWSGHTSTTGEDLGPTRGFAFTTVTQMVPAVAIGERAGYGANGFLFAWNESTPEYYGYVYTSRATGQTGDYHPASFTRQITTDVGTGPLTQPTPGNIELSSFIVGEDNALFAQSTDGTGQRSLVALGANLAVGWQIPDDGPAIATSDGGIVGQSGTKFDGNGATGEAVDMSAALTRTQLVFYGSMAVSTAVPPFEVASGVWPLLGGSLLGQGVADSHMPVTPETVVRCRLVDHWFAGWIARAEHCYVVSYGRGGAFTTEGGEEKGRSQGTLRINRNPGDQVGVNRRTDNGVFRAFGPLQVQFSQCLKEEADRMNAARYPYYYLGPNSNTALNTMMRNCGQSVTLPLVAPGGRDTYPPQ